LQEWIQEDIQTWLGLLGEILALGSIVLVVMLFALIIEKLLKQCNAIE